MTTAAEITVTTADGGKTAVCVVTVNVAVVFQSAVQTEGVSNESDSTGVTLTFSADPESLTAENITVTGAAKGALSGSGATRSLAISNITVANGESVSEQALRTRIRLSLRTATAGTRRNTPATMMAGAIRTGICRQ